MTHLPNIRPEHIVPPDVIAPAEITRWMHGHQPFEPDNAIARLVWRKPTKAERRVYSGAVSPRSFGTDRFVMPNERRAA